MVNTYNIGAFCDWSITQQAVGFVKSVDGVPRIKPEQTLIAWTLNVKKNMRQTIMNPFFNVVWIPEETFFLVLFRFYSVCHFINPKTPFTCNQIVVIILFHLTNYSDNLFLILRWFIKNNHYENDLSHVRIIQQFKIRTFPWNILF